MVKLIGLCFILLSHCVHAANLTLDLSNANVEMGKYIVATFTYKGNSKPELIDLDLWQDDFYIEQSDADLNQVDTDSIVSITTARLYPRHIGKITLDAIALSGSFIKPHYIKASPSIRNDIDATPKIQRLKSHYWADEVIIFSVDIPLHYVRNEVIAKEWLINGFIITELPSVKTNNTVQLNWMIYTPYKGTYSLELPAIVQRGKGRFRFHSPKLEFTVKPLPAYLPSSVPSGSIKITSTIIENGDRKIVNISLKKAAYLPKEIEGFQQFIDRLSDDELELNIQTEDKLQQGITTRQIKITLPKWLWRRQAMLNISFFNTKTGQLDQIQHPLPSFNTIPNEAFIFIIIFFITIIFFILKLLKPSFKRMADRKKLKKLVLKAKNASEFRLVILQKNRCKTLDQWAKQSFSNNAFELSNVLNKACYNDSIDYDLNKLKETFLKIEAL